MLKFIGNGSAFNTELGNNSAYIKDGNYLFLIDCGSNIFDRLKTSNILEGVKNIEVLITHFHPDHIGSLGDLIFYAYYVLNAHLTVLTPEGNMLIDILDSMGVNISLYDCVLIDRKKGSFLVGLDVDIKPILTKHVDELICYGYILKYNEIADKEYSLGDRVSYNSTVYYYSGDSNIIPNEIMEIFISGEINMIYQDTCSQDYDGNVHLSIRKLQEYIEPSERHRVYCMHLDEKFDREYAESLGFNVVRNIYQEHSDFIKSLHNGLFM